MNQKRTSDKNNTDYQTCDLHRNERIDTHMCTKCCRVETSIELALHMTQYCVVLYEQFFFALRTIARRQIKNTHVIPEIHVCTIIYAYERAYARTSVNGFEVKRNKKMCNVSLSGAIREITINIIHTLSTICFLLFERLFICWLENKVRLKSNFIH